MNRSLAGGLLAVALAAASPSPLARQTGNLERAQWRVVDLTSGQPVGEARGDRFGRPVLPGSFMKVPALIAALASRTISPETRVSCQGQTTVDGRVIRCSHPRVRHALRAAEALALSCNVYFATIAQRLPRGRLDGVLTALGLPPTPGRVPMALVATGLEGSETSPVALLTALSRFVLDPAVVPLGTAGRQAVLDGLRGSAVYGTSSAFALRGVAAYAKTGTTDASGGGVQGLVIAVWPADKPTRGIVLVAPGVAGMDAADLAAQVASRRFGPDSSARLPASVPRVQRHGPGEAAAVVLRIGTPKREGGYAVERIPLEEYVARVLGGEAASRSGVAALEALAITARTFALANGSRHHRDGFDLCTLTHCQVLREPTAAMRAAVASTAGRVLEWRDRPAPVFYTASCGGYSERPSAVWPGSKDPPFLRAHRDRACEGEPRWAAEIAAHDLEHVLRGAGFRGALRDVARTGRTGSGRVAHLKLAGLAPDAIAATDFRTLIGRSLGWHLIKSTDFTVRRRSGGFYFEGHGFGHGVGLCVLGSVRRAEHGDSATDILKAYFPGLKVTSAARFHLSPPVPASTPAPTIASGEPVEPAEPDQPVQPDKPGQPGKPAQPVDPGSAGGRFVLVLPPSVEPDRAAIGGLVDRALDFVASAAGRPVPAGLRIVFHPSVASFQRETGETWWSAARTRDLRIDLQPPEALQQRGTLEMSLRHELAHAITAPVVAGRAEWVREGAAMHFAGERPPQSLIGTDGIPRRVRCPSDQEVRRPTSAALARQAYGLAAACFERALIENGGQWEEVR